jgi:regulator of RNase E activity RraB
MGKNDYPDDDDGQALRLVVQNGSDMSRPMDIDFALAVPDENTGREVAKAAEAAGYRTEVVFDEGEELEDEAATPSWTCYCTKTMLATYEGVIAAQRELELLSSPFGGYPDGWGTFGNVEES